MIDFVKHYIMEPSLIKPLETIWFLRPVLNGKEKVCVSFEEDEIRDMVELNDLLQSLDKQTAINLFYNKKVKRFGEFFGEYLFSKTVSNLDLIINIWSSKQKIRNRLNGLEDLQTGDISKFIYKVSFKKDQLRFSLN
jgi:hypothetical protein